MFHKIKSVVVFLKTIVTFVLSRPFGNINKDLLKQVHRKINAKNCTFRLPLVVIFNSKYANNLYEKTIFKLNKML